MRPRSVSPPAGPSIHVTPSSLFPPGGSGSTSEVEHLQGPVSQQCLPDHHPDLPAPNRLAARADGGESPETSIVHSRAAGGAIALRSRAGGSSRRGNLGSAAIF